MKLTNYLKDKISIIIITIISIILITLLDIAFKVPEGLIIVTIVLLLLTLIIALLISYFQKRTFYNTLITNTKNIDRKYLSNLTKNQLPPYFPEIPEAGYRRLLFSFRFRPLSTVSGFHYFQDANMPCESFLPQSIILYTAVVGIANIIPLTQ